MNLFERIGKAIFKDASTENEIDEKAMKEIAELQNEQGGESQLVFHKDSETGQLRWTAAWSSNYLDDDNPPDILSEEAHKDFLDRVEKGLIPYPELRHWHTEGTKWGQSDWLAYDEDAGIVWASGTVDKGHEGEALSLMKSEIELGVSHGMKDIVRSPDDEKVIAQYTTYEISDLPLRWAANKMTALFIAEKNSTEVNMTLSDEKKEYLRDAGLTDEQINGLDDFGKQQAEKFSNRARKDNEADNESDEQEVEQAEDTKQETESEEQDDDNAELESEKAEGETSEEPEQPEDAEDGEKQEEPEDDAEDEVDQVTAMKAIFETSFKEFGDGVVKALEKIEARVSELEKANEKREKREKEKEFEPLSKGLLEKLSVIGSKEAELDEDDELKNQKPKETESKDGEFGDAGNFSEFLAKNLFGE